MENTLNSLRDTLEHRFGLVAEPVVLTGGLSHQVFELKSQKIVVKIYSDEITTKRLAQELQALELLTESKLVTAPQLLPSLNLEFRVRFGPTFLSCFKMIEGERRYNLTECPKDLGAIQDIGRYLGKLHLEYSSGLVAEEPVRRTSQILELIKTLPGVELAEVEQILETLKNSRAPFFRTHGDFQQSNILYSGDTISGVIDFEYSNLDFRINDLAGCLSNLLSADEDTLPPDSLVESFVQGYQGTFSNALLPAEMSLLGLLVKLIWRVNLFWVENKLKNEQSEENLSLLRRYRDQTLRGLSN